MAMNNVYVETFRNGKDGISPEVTTTPLPDDAGTRVNIKDWRGDHAFNVYNGQDGADGQRGEQGEDGKSAYEIAVEYGYTGTEEEWSRLTFNASLSADVITGRYPDVVPNTRYYMVKIPDKLSDGTPCRLKVGYVRDSATGEYSMMPAADFANKVSSPFVINAGTFDATAGNKPFYYMISDGVKQSDVSSSGVPNRHFYDTMYMTEDGHMHFVTYTPIPENYDIEHWQDFDVPNYVTADVLLNTYHAYNATGGFAAIVIDGVKRDASVLSFWEGAGQGNGQPNPRTIIAEDENGNYSVAVFGGRDQYNDVGITYAQAAEFAYTVMGAYNAYCLDGGGSSQMAINGVNVTRPVDSNGTAYRNVGSFIYIPTIEEPSAICDERKRTNEVNTILHNFSQSNANGRQILRGDNPGIDFYPVGENYNKRFAGIVPTSKDLVRDEEAYSHVAAFAASVDGDVVFRAGRFESDDSSLPSYFRGLYDAYGKLARLYDMPPSIGKYYFATFRGNGSTAQFTIAEKPDDDAIYSVTVNSEEIKVNEGYTYNDSTGVIAFVEAPTEDALIKIKWLIRTCDTDYTDDHFMCYRYATNTANRPDASTTSYGVVIQLPYNLDDGSPVTTTDGIATQIAINMANGKMYYRKHQNGVWESVWTEYGSDKQNVYILRTVTLDADNWTNKSQTVSVSGVTADNLVQVSPVPSSVAKYATAQIICTSQSANSLTFTAENVPSADISVNVVIWE